MTHLVCDGALVLVDLVALGLLDGDTLGVLHLAAHGVVHRLALGLNIIEIISLKSLQVREKRGRDSPHTSARTCPRSGSHTSRPPQSCTACRTQCRKPGAVIETHFNINQI